MGETGAKRLAMVVDLARCTGCQACSVACKAENQVPVGAHFTWVEVVELGRYPRTRRRFRPSLCNQCSQASCLEGCPVGATYRAADGVVRVDPHRCIGCKYCFWTCPYGVRTLDEESGICRKCEFCEHRLARGQLPACVEACPSGALSFGDLAAPDSPLAARLARGPAWVLRPQTGNGPQVWYVGLEPRLARSLQLGAAVGDDHGL